MYVCIDMRVSVLRVCKDTERRCTHVSLLFSTYTHQFTEKEETARDGNHDRTDLTTDAQGLVEPILFI